MEATQVSTQENGKPGSHIKPQLSITPEEYMHDRVIYKMQVYDRLSKQQKLLYQTTSLVGIILAASVPVLINLGVDSIVPTVLSLIVTILVSVEKLFHFREHWRNYDEMAAFLRSEQLKFQTKAGEYARKDDNSDPSFQKFVTRTERAIIDERKETIEMRTREDAAK